MKRIKTRCDLEFPEWRTTAQNLIENAKKFKKEGRENIGEQDEPIVEQIAPQSNSKLLNWTTKKKIDVVKMDKEVRAKGRTFMTRVKER